MAELVFNILSLSGLIVLVLAIIAGCLYASLWLFGKILKLSGNWADTYKIMVLYFQMKRNKKTIEYRGEVYRKVED